MNASLSSSRLNCPLRREWVSFRLVDEHGSGHLFAGLAYQLQDSLGQRYTGALDSDGYARVEQLPCGLIVLQLLDSYVGSDYWYAAISRREKFTLPLTALQVAAEQVPSGPRRTDGKTYLAEARASQEKARFFESKLGISLRLLAIYPRQTRHGSRALQPFPNEMSVCRKSNRESC